MFDRITFVVGLDAKTIEQFRIASRTWVRFYPELQSAQWIAFFDAQQLTADDVLRAMNALDIHQITLLTWGLGRYESQREKMLTGFVVRVPPQVRTDWWCKIDCDALAYRRDTWPVPAWFEPWKDQEFNNQRAGIIGAKWNYTKPADQMAALDRWADECAAVPGLPLRLPYNPDASRCVHPRIASWLSFYRTQFTLDALKYCERGCDADHMPVPSQDGFHWYMATRLRYPVSRVKMKSYGWTNVSNTEKLRETANAILRG